jgi:hypothetical protein
MLAQVVWEALDDAGVPPSSLAGTETGVYVGASSLDYMQHFVQDPGSVDAQIVTGNTLGCGRDAGACYTSDQNRRGHPRDRDEYCAAPAGVWWSSASRASS